jgi:hypothetical protein
MRLALPHAVQVDASIDRLPTCGDFLGFASIEISQGRRMPWRLGWGNRMGRMRPRMARRMAQTSCIAV